MDQKNLADIFEQLIILTMNLLGDCVLNRLRCG